MKQRIDVVLVERGLAHSRNIAAAMIMAGEVTVGQIRADKPSQMVPQNAEIMIKEKPRYVSRAGDKLASVVVPLSIHFNDKVVLDVGSSTGGFTDVALQNGASRVICVDVGNAQLAYKLRQDPRVTVHERTDIRNVRALNSPNSESMDQGKLLLIPQANIAMIDVSFISLHKVLSTVTDLLMPSGVIIAMMKPQFEAGKALADTYKGLILDENIRQELISEFRGAVSKEFQILSEADSEVKGLHGNRERFFVLRPKR
ncbi:MAG: TlyA family RNA methyltransferase [Candidatus Saccharimonadia bacterium]